MKISSLSRRILFLVLACLFLTVPVSATGTSGLDMSVNSGCHTIDGKIPLLGTTEEITNVQSAFLYDYTNDTLLYSLNADAIQYPASLVKIMTGLIIAERGNMTDQVTVSQDLLDSLPSGSLDINLQAGEVISLEDLLYCILVESANDASVVAAAHVCGSVENFVLEMNSYAQKLGCTQTNFVNVHGLHDEFQVTTARDMARILSVAAKNETFMAAFSTVNYTVPATNLSEPRELSSSNFMMNDDQMIIYLDSRVTGGRTGVVDTGERNLAVTAERNGIKLISIVMGSQSVFSESGRSVITFGSFLETSALLDMGFRGHHPVQLFYKDQVLKQYKVVNGSSYVSTGVNEQVTALLPYCITYNDLSYRYNEDTTVINAPVKAGEKISTVQVWHNNICLAQADLFAMHDVGIKQVVATEEIVDEPESDGFSILIAVTVIVALLLIFLFGRRLIFRIIRNHKLRRHRKNRRRSR